MSELLPAALTAFATTMATKGAEAPAKTFNNLWQYVFGPLDNYLIAQINKRQNNNEIYARSITEKAEKIPKENLQEPPISILGPGLEASKFYIDEYELREMFASLLAASFDNRQSDRVHQSFIEIIKQLSPIDAENLKIFFNSPISLPIANYLIDKGERKQQPLKNFIFLSNPNTLNIDKQASSITNLKRLGLIDVTFTKWLTDDNHYSLIDNNNLIDEYNSDLCEANQKVIVEKGITFLTPFGIDFCSICLN